MVYESAMAQEAALGSRTPTGAWRRMRGCRRDRGGAGTDGHRGQHAGRSRPQDPGCPWRDVHRL